MKAKQNSCLLTMYSIMYNVDIKACIVCLYYGPNSSRYDPH